VRIAFVSDAIYPYNKGGKEKRLFELSTRLAAMGHDVHIYSMKWWDGPKDIEENGLHLHAISKLYPMYSGDRRSIKEGVIFGLACYKMFFEKYDVVDVDHMPFFPIFSMWVVCKLKNKKLFGTWHETLKHSEWVEYMGFIPGTIASIIEHTCLRLPYKITVSSVHTTELITSKLKQTKQLIVVPPGIDIEKMKRVKKASQECDVLFVGRLVKDKNVSLLVTAMKEVIKFRKEIQCVIIGTGTEEKKLNLQIKQLKLGKYVHIIAPLAKHQEVYGYMKAAKVFVLPSRREGFGIVVLEALACGTPVITPNYPSNAAKSLILEGLDGTVVVPTAEALAFAINKWLDERPNKKSMSDFVNNYDWNHLAQKQAEVYQI
jgi:glycosyltransferase involved in cell wall biosynthesis